MSQALYRALGLSVFDVQLLAALGLARGAIVEMATGEGKTLSAGLAAFLFALRGRGCHVATSNRYLARRDYEQLAPAFQVLGLSTGLIDESDSHQVKRQAYARDVTFGTGYEFGFDWLRDQQAARTNTLANRAARSREVLRGDETAWPARLQRGHAHAIIDEVDSVLIDEARLPLILQQTAPRPTADARLYLAARDAARQLRSGVDYRIHVGERRVELSDARHAALRAPCHDLMRPRLERPWVEYVEQALVAERILQRDVDYVVKAGAVALVDEFTGRVFTERTWRGGLHQAVEVKEGILPRAENPSSARITRQNYFRLYESICGMTGTAVGAEREFFREYGLPVIVIPLRRPCLRQEWPTRFFAGAEAKFQAIAEEVAHVAKRGRPVLVGSRTIANSERLAMLLQSRGLDFQLLNGKQDADEAQIIAGAGQWRAVTIATNMAGRGADIKLDARSANLGGLHVIGVERHLERRIDRQLAGRAARQGDPGTCRFFVSADDPLLERFAPSLAARLRALGKHSAEINVDFSVEVGRAQSKASRTA